MHKCKIKHKDKDYHYENNNTILNKLDKTKKMPLKNFETTFLKSFRILILATDS